jgi:hypothetical protein
MRTRVSIGMIVSSCLVSTLAFAQPGADDGDGTAPPPPPAPAPVMAPPPPTAPMPPPPPQEPASTVDKGIEEDANAGRSWVAPTALTEPAGTWSFSDFQLFLVSLAYSPTDQISLSATTMLPITSGVPFWLLLNGKIQVVKSGNLRVALQGALSFMSVKDENIDSMGNTTSDRSSLTAAVIGGAATYCLDAECRSAVNAYVGAGFARQSESAVPLLLSGSVAFGVSKHVKLLLEADTGYIAGDINEFADGFLGWYGVRFTSKIIGVDLGFAYPVCDGCEDITDEIPMGFPFVGFTYRSFKD